MPALDYRLGIDVGGTNTDAVILDRADQVLAKAKVPTTPDVTGGIVAALDAVIGTSRVEREPDHARDARDHARDQRGARAPQAAPGGGDQDRRAQPRSASGRCSNGRPT